MWMTELTTNTMTAEIRVGSQTAKTSDMCGSCEVNGTYDRGLSCRARMKLFRELLLLNHLRGERRHPELPAQGVRDQRAIVGLLRRVSGPLELSSVNLWLVNRLQVPVERRRHDPRCRRIAARDRDACERVRKQVVR